MPQATDDLRAKFPGWDAEALEVLAENFTDTRGVFRKKNPAYQPTEREWEAINYMFQEWDYGYEEISPEADDEKE
jgi:hypothetical protein